MIGWAAETLLATGLLFALVLLIRAPVARVCGAQWAYALWLLPLSRLAMPPLAWFGADPLLPDIAVRGGAPQAGAPLLIVTAPETVPWLPLLLGFWAAGVGVFILWQWFAYRSFLLRIRADYRPSYPALFEGVPIAESRAISGPVAVGFTTPRIIVPFDFLSRYSSAEQALALRHEWIHHRRGDLWWNLLALAMLAAHWFNPIAWIAFRAFRADQEQACDAAVIASAPACSRRAYGQALVKSASRSGLLVACPLNNASQLKGRLKMMGTHRSSRLRSIAGGLVIAGTFATGLCLSAPTLAQEAKSEPVRERKIMIREFGKGGEMTEITPELRERLSRCPEAQRLESDVRSQQDGDKIRTRVVVCSPDGASSPATREKLAAALDRARVEIGEIKDISPERRAQILDALRREMDQIRSPGK